MEGYNLSAPFPRAVFSSAWMWIELEMDKGEGEGQTCENEYRSTR